MNGLSYKDSLMKTLGMDSETFEVYKRAGLLKRLKRCADFGGEAHEPKPHYHRHKKETRSMKKSNILVHEYVSEYIGAENF